MKQSINSCALWAALPLFLVGLFFPRFATAQFTADNYTFSPGPIVKEDAFYGGLIGFVGTDGKGYYVARSSAPRKLVVTAFDPVLITIDYFDKDLNPVNNFVLENIFSISNDKSDKNSLEFFLRPPKKKPLAIYSSYDKKKSTLMLHYKEIISSQGEFSEEATISKFVLADKRINPRGKFSAIYSADSSLVAFFGYNKIEYGEEIYPAYVVVCNDKLEPLWQKSFDLWDDSLFPELEYLRMDPTTIRLSNTGKLYLLGQGYVPSKRKKLQDGKVRQRSFLFEVNSEMIVPYSLDVNEELIRSMDMAWNQQEELIIVGLGEGEKTYGQLFIGKFILKEKSFLDPLLLPLDEIWIEKYVKEALTFRHLLIKEDGSYLLVAEDGFVFLEAKNIVLFDVSASGELRKLACLEKEQRVTVPQAISYLRLPGNELALLYLNKKKTYQLGKYDENGNTSVTDVFKYGEDEALEKYVLFNNEYIEVNANKKIFLAVRLDAKYKADYRLVGITAKE